MIAAIITVIVGISCLVASMTLVSHAKTFDTGECKLNYKDCGCCGTDFDENGEAIPVCSKVGILMSTLGNNVCPQALSDTFELSHTRPVKCINHPLPWRTCKVRGLGLKPEGYLEIVDKGGTPVMRNPVEANLAESIVRAVNSENSNTKIIRKLLEVAKYTFEYSKSVNEIVQPTPERLEMQRKLEALIEETEGLLKEHGRRKSCGQT